MIIAVRAQLFAALSAAVVCAACSTPTERVVPTPSASTPSPMPSRTEESPGAGVTLVPGGEQALTDGVAHTTIESLDVAQQTAVFAVRCGRTVSANKVIPPGLYRVNLRKAIFQMTSNPADPSTGHVTDICSKIT